MASLSILGDEAVIRFAQADEAAAAKHEIDCIDAEHQCRIHIASHPTKQFSLKFDGCFPGPAVEVTIKHSLLQQLPLLKDVQSSTHGGEGTSTQVDLPCTVWGLVSLLILLGGVGMEEWFGGDASNQGPSLPANTLLVRHCS